MAAKCFSWQHLFFINYVAGPLHFFVEIIVIHLTVNKDGFNRRLFLMNKCVEPQDGINVCKKKIDTQTYKRKTFLLYAKFMTSVL